MRIVLPTMVSAALVLSAISTARCVAAPIFYATATPVGHWYVSTNVNPAGDGLLSSFSTSNFIQAVNVTYDSSRQDWIADTAGGSHGGVGNWTFFVFRQTFDLTGYDPTTASLTFDWAADDSGEIFASRGSWIPAFSLNGGAFVNYPGSTPSNRVPTYSYSSPVTVNSGFVSGLNTIDFYVEGNGQTDGFGLQEDSFIVSVPEPASFSLLSLASATLLRRRRRS